MGCVSSLATQQQHAASSNGSERQSEDDADQLVINIAEVCYASHRVGSGDDGINEDGLPRVSGRSGMRDAPPLKRPVKQLSLDRLASGTPQPSNEGTAPTGKDSCFEDPWREALPAARHHHQTGGLYSL